MMSKENFHLNSAVYMKALHEMYDKWHRYDYTYRAKLENIKLQTYRNDVQFIQLNLKLPEVQVSEDVLSSYLRRDS